MAQETHGQEGENLNKIRYISTFSTPEYIWRRDDGGVKIPSSAQRRLVTPVLHMRHCGGLPSASPRTINPDRDHWTIHSARPPRPDVSVVEERDVMDGGLFLLCGCSRVTA
jgi:hypothetical protein